MNINITDAQNAIISAFKKNFKRVTVESYEPSAALSELAPACLLDLEEFPKGSDIGDGRYPARCRFSVHCVLGHEVEDMQLELREFAVAVSQFVSEEGIWLGGSVMKPPTNIDAYPGNFKKDTNGGYDSWVVSWEQTIYLGASKWEAPEERGSIRLAINPQNDDQPEEYQPLEITDAPTN